MLGGTIGAGHAGALGALGAPDAARATRDAWWARRWRGWAGWPLDGRVLLLAAAAVVVDVATAWIDLSIGHLGRIPLSPALPLAVLLAARLGAAALGWSRAGILAWREYAVVVGTVTAVGVVAYASDVGGAQEAIGLVVAAVGEELVYRLALLVVVGAATAWLLDRDWRDPRHWGTAPGVVALGAGAVVFTALPGHVAQMQGVTTVLPFASLAIVLGWVVLRTGAVWTTIVAHSLLNLATMTVLADGAPVALSAALAAATLVALVAAADLAGRRDGRLRPVPSVIDLTAI